MPGPLSIARWAAPRAASVARAEPGANNEMDNAKSASDFTKRHDSSAWCAAYNRESPPKRVRQSAEQPGWTLHSAELKLAHCAAVPAQAAQVQPLSMHKPLVMLVAQASGVPVQEPAQWQPETLLQVAALPRVVHAGGRPVQAGSQTQPESVHVMSEMSFGQTVAVPPHLLPAQLQPSTLRQAAEVFVVEQIVGAPEHVSVGAQPLAAEHSLVASVAHDGAVPMQTGAPPDPALATEPAAPAVDAPPEPAWLAVPPAPLAGEVPAPAAVPPSPPGLVPASPLALPPVSFEIPAAPAESLFGAPASPLVPDELMSLLELPQATLNETAHGTNHIQEDRFMPHGWQSGARFYYRDRS